MTQEKISKVGSRLLCEAMQKILKDGGSAPFSVLRTELEKESIPKEFRGFYGSNKRDPKWVVAIHSMADRFDKAGFLTREAGIWGVTPAGERALSDGNEAITEKAKDVAVKIYRQKAKAKKGEISYDVVDEDKLPEKNAGEIAIKTALYDTDGKERKKIRDYILKQSANSQYGEKLVAVLLRAIGYEAKETQQSRDGGVDVIATAGELGISHIFVQVKNQQHPVGEKPMRELAGVLTDKSDTDVGLFISFSGFLPGSEEFAKRSNKQIKLMDGFKFIHLWCKHYDKLSDDAKKLLPLKPIYFLDEERAKPS